MASVVHGVLEQPQRTAAGRLGLVEGEVGVAHDLGALAESRTVIPAVIKMVISCPDTR